MKRNDPSGHRLVVSLFVLLWFFVWGVCPWDRSSSAAHAGEATHANHGHHGDMDDTHHASKGTEHSCSGSISYSSNAQKERLYEQVGSVGRQTFAPAELSFRLTQSHGYQKPLFERNILPKLLTEYYQLYSIYRI